MISARMRGGASWSDARILNVSSRGLLIQAPAAPRPASYIEVRRGTHVVVARVVWTDTGRFGVLTQDELPVDEFISEVVDAPIAADAPLPSQATDRRAPARDLQARHDRSRAHSRTIEFTSIAIIAVLAATLLCQAVTKALANPLDQVSAAIGPS